MTIFRSTDFADGKPVDSAFDSFNRSISSLFNATYQNLIPHLNCHPSFCGFNSGYFLSLSLSGPSVALCRDSERILACGVDHLLLMLNISGDCLFNAEGRSDRAGPGDIICLDLSRPVTLSLTSYSIIALIIPRHRIKLPSRTIDAAHGTIVRATSPIGVLLERHLTMIGSIAPQCLGADLDLAAEIVDSLATAGVAAALGMREERQSKMLMPSVQIIREHIEQTLSNVALTPESIGRHFGLSRSALYRLFQPLGGIADYIRDRRLSRAMLHISSVGAARGAVAKLALQCGFPSEAAFSRAFRQQFGLTPKEAIARSGALGETNDPQNETQLLKWLRDLANTKQRHMSR